MYSYNYMCFLGNLTVAKAYVAWSTTNEERTKAMSLAGGFELFGMISGPGK